jgi:hypothetical protein
MKWWRVSVEPLTIPMEISFNDIIVMVILLTDFLQTIAIGPDFSSLSWLLKVISSAISVDISALVEMEEGVYWILLQCIIGLCGLWFVLVLMILQKIDIRLERFSICRDFTIVAENILPVLGNAMFLPIVSILLDVYICDKAVGDKPYKFTDSYLWRDCHEFCWKDDHLYYAVFGFISLFLYLPLAVYMRPMWQNW